MNLKEFDKALDYCRKGLDFCEKYPDEKGKQQLMRASGAAFRQKGNYREAKKYYDLALELAEKKDDKIQIAITNNSLGQFYMDIGEWDKAKDSLEKSLEIRSKLGAVVGVEKNNIGNIYQRIGMLEDAEEYFKQSLELYKEGNGIYGIYFNYRDLANNFFIRGDLDQALYFSEKCLDIARREKYPAKSATITKANILFLQDKLEEAYKLYKNAVTLKSRIEDDILSLIYQYLRKRKNIFALCMNKAMKTEYILYA